LAYTPRVIVKMSRAAAPSGEAFALAAESMPEAARDLRFRPLFGGRADRFAALAARAAEADPSQQPAPLDMYYVAEVPPGVDAAELAKTLSNAPGVELAYVEGRPAPPPFIDPTDDDLQPMQGYLDPAPDGIDAEFAWPRADGSGFPGGDGAGVRFIDLEQGWTLNHEDLAAAGITLLSGINNVFVDHGTSVLGEVVAVDNDRGCVGIAPAAPTRVVSQWRTPNTFSTAEAIMDAVDALSFGDVLLLEAQTFLDPNAGTGPFVPVETEPAIFDVIRLATSLGIVVIEAAANGNVDLDLYAHPVKGDFLNRASAAFSDSGAIMVGAAGATHPHVRLGFSNHGSRIDCYGWGERVRTTTSPSTTAYTSGFSGTSSASPIIAGAAILIQAMAETNLGFRFSPLQLRAILADPANGTASDNPAADRIGVMPDLRRIIENVLHLVPDIYVRDHVGDSGDPHTGAVASSPDVIVKPSPAADDPQAAFGEGSGTEDSTFLGFQPEDGTDNFVYVRMRNRGGSVAANVTATVYWSPAATLVTPNLWNLIGSVSMPPIPTGNLLTVSPPLLWPQASMPGAGHYCFVALIGTANDPAPLPADFLDFEDYLRFIRENNNVTWRNFNVVHTDADVVALPFLITGPPDRARRMEVVAEPRLPQGAEVVLTAARSITDAVRRLLPSAGAQMRLAPQGRQRILEEELPAGLAAPAELQVRIPQELRFAEYEIAVRQLFEGREVGRITWRLAPRARRRRAL
jgi:hypothetical protein